MNAGSRQGLLLDLPFLEIIRDLRDNTNGRQHVLCESLELLHWRITERHEVAVVVCVEHRMVREVLESQTYFLFAAVHVVDNVTLLFLGFLNNHIVERVSLNILVYVVLEALVNVLIYLLEFGVVLVEQDVDGLGLLVSALQKVRVEVQLRLSNLE